MSNHGQKFEKVIEHLLTINGIEFERNVRAPSHISKINAVDFKIGNLWVMATKDVKKATYQTDRLEHTYQMFQAEVWKEGEVFVVVADPGPPSGKRMTERYTAAAEAYAAIDGKIIGTVDDLIERIKNEQTK